MTINAITPLEIIRRFREQKVHDTGGDMGSAPAGYSYAWEEDDSNPLWKNHEILDYLNAARQEITARQPIRDDETFTIDLMAGTQRYTYDARILRLRGVVLQSTGAPLVKKVREWFDANIQDWRTEQGEVGAYGEDTQNRVLYLVKIPTASDTLLLQSERTVVSDILWSGRGVPMTEPDPIHVEDLLEWMQHLAYQKRDTQTFNPQKSLEHKLIFDQCVGPPLTARDLDWSRQLANLWPRTTAYYR